MAVSSKKSSEILITMAGRISDRSQIINRILQPFITSTWMNYFLINKESYISSIVHDMSETLWIP